MKIITAGLVILFTAIALAQPPTLPPRPVMSFEDAMEGLEADTCQIAMRKKWRSDMRNDYHQRKQGGRIQPSHPMPDSESVVPHVFYLKVHGVYIIQYMGEISSHYEPSKNDSVANDWMLYGCSSGGGS